MGGSTQRPDLPDEPERSDESAAPVERRREGVVRFVTDDGEELPILPARVRLKIELPSRTIFKILLTLAVLWLLSQIWTVLFEIFLGVIVAMALRPLVTRLERRGLGRIQALAVVLVGLVGAFALLLAIVVPRAADDLSDFWTNLPTYLEDSLSWIEPYQPTLYDNIIAWGEDLKQRDVSEGIELEGVLNAGRTLATGIGNAFIVLVIACYVLIDRDYRFFNWLARDLSPSNRRKLNRTLPAVTEVVSGYVLGQGLICLCFSVFAFIVLTVLGVPSALILAIVAFAADAIPLIGIIIATAPATLLGLTEGFWVGAVVLAAFLLYQQFENYVLAPRIFSRTLNLSPLAILVAVLIGSQLLGILGVLLALPIAASIPVIERIWLHDEGSGVGRQASEATEGRGTGNEGQTHDRERIPSLTPDA